MKVQSKVIFLLAVSMAGILTGSCGYVKALNGKYGRDYSWGQGGFVLNTTDDDAIVQTVATSLTNLTPTFVVGDTADNVTQSFTLPMSIDGCAITWTASDGSSVVVDANGSATVTRKNAASNATVTLTATITKGSATATKSFDVVVVRNLSDAEAVASCKERLTTAAITFAAPDTAAAVTQNLTLPSTFSDCSVAWASGSASTISNAGVVTRPSGAAASDATVTLTATVSKGYDSDTKAVTVIVAHDTTDAEAVAVCKANLSTSVITLGGSDTVSAVTQNVSLPASFGGCSLTWSSGTPGTISNAGVVTRPASGSSNATVTLTATISRNSDAGATDSKGMNFTVVAHTNASYVASCKSLLSTNDFLFSGTDTASSVTGNITLPAVKGSCTLTWSSGTPSVIANDGTYGTRPLCSATNATVSLTATISFNGVNDTKALTVTAPKWTPAQAVTHDLPLVAIGYTNPDTAASVTQDLALLPTSGSYGSTVTWTSDIPSHIPDGSSGVVNRGYGSADSTVTLTAAVACSTTSQTTTFPLTVIKLGTIDLSDSSLSAGISGGGTLKMSTKVNVAATLTPAGATVMYRACAALSTSASLASITTMDAITNVGTCSNTFGSPLVLPSTSPACCTIAVRDDLYFKVPGSGQTWRFRVYAYAQGAPAEDHHKRLYDVSGDVTPN
jgi:hypothetical protein